MNEIQTNYDVFLSYNGDDGEAVQAFARAFRDKGLSPFLDRWYLRPGLPWPERLEAAMGTCRAAVIFLSDNGWGPWHNRERQMAIQRQIKDPAFPVLPVILPGGAEEQLGLLGANSWIDARTGGIEEAVNRVVQSLNGLPQPCAGLCSPAFNPYRGLLAFEEQHGPFYFGREVYIEELARVVVGSPFTAVIGASGSGKSSLVRAGLIPLVRNGLDHRVWEVATVVPDQRPYRELAASLIPLLEPTATEVDRLARGNQLAEHFEGGTISVADAVKRALDKQEGTQGFLLVIDQWEELYTLGRNPSATRAFIDGLIDSLPRIPALRVVATLRADFVGHALDYRPVADLLQDHTLHLGPMRYGELKRAVEEPARRVGCELEPGLADSILADAGEFAGSIPILQFVLTALFERRSTIMLHQVYEEMGRFGGAISHHADQVLRRLQKRDGDLARSLFTRLVRLGEGTAHTRRRAPLSELDDVPAELIKTLADARMITTDRIRGTRETTVEVPHEALIASWAQLKQWLEEDRGFLMWRQRLQDRMAEWRAEPGDPDTLLRGKALEDALRWVSSRESELNTAESDFVRISQSKRQAEEADKQFRQWYGRIEQKFHIWVGCEHDSHYLLPEQDVLEAERWLSQRAPDFTDAVTDFVMRSRKIHPGQAEAKTGPGRVRRFARFGVQTVGYALVFIVMLLFLWTTPYPYLMKHLPADSSMGRAWEYLQTARDIREYTLKSLAIPTLSPYHEMEFQPAWITLLQRTDPSEAREEMSVVDSERRQKLLNELNLREYSRPGWHGSQEEMNRILPLYKQLSKSDSARRHLLERALVLMCSSSSLREQCRQAWGAAVTSVSGGNWDAESLRALARSAPPYLSVPEASQLITTAERGRRRHLQIGFVQRFLALNRVSDAKDLLLLKTDTEAADGDSTWSVTNLSIKLLSAKSKQERDEIARQTERFLLAERDSSEGENPAIEYECALAALARNGFYREVRAAIRNWRTRDVEGQVALVRVFEILLDRQEPRLGAARLLIRILPSVPDSE